MPDSELIPPDGGHDDWLSIGQVAERLNVKAATVRLWVRNGRLPAIRTGGRVYRVRTSDLTRLLDAGKSSGFREAEASTGDGYSPPVSEFHARLSVPSSGQ